MAVALRNNRPSKEVELFAGPDQATSD